MIPSPVYEVSTYSHCQQRVYSVFMIIIIPVTVQWYLIAILICVSQTANDEHLFNEYIGHLYIFSGGMCMEILWLFLDGLFLFFYYCIIRVLQIPVLSQRYGSKIFSPIPGAIIPSFSMLSFEAQKISVLVTSDLPISFYCSSFNIIPKKPTLILSHANLWLHSLVRHLEFQH